MAIAARFLKGDEAWQHIRAGVKKGPAYVAVAWWGSGMSRLLPLKRGSVLVVQADFATMKQGQTNPMELEDLVKRGVRVFPMRNLHAKVFVFQRAAFVGSMNASTNSWDGRLLEAAVEVTVKSAVDAAKAQVLRWACDKPLDLDDIKELKKHYDPQGGGRAGGKRTTTKPQRALMDLPLLEVLRTHRGGWEEHTQERYDADGPALRKEAARAGEDLEAIEWTGGGVPSVEAHVRVLEIGEEEDGSVWVSAPARVRLVTSTKKGQPEKLIYLTRATGVRRKRLSQVAKTLGRNSELVRLLKGRGRIFKNPGDLARLFGLWGIKR